MKASLLAGACAAALFAPAAAAQTAPAQRPLVGGHGNNVTAFIAQHDENADGRVSWDEFDAFRRARFDATDANGDGVVDVEEYVQEFEDRSRQALERARDAQVEQTRARFASLDRDKDGKVSRAEFDASGERVFAAGEKLLAAAPEAKAGGERTAENAARFDNAAGNRQGLLPSSHDRPGYLALYDADADGTVSRAEFERARDQQFARTDGDKDGVLGLDEYLAEYEDRLDRRIATLAGDDKQTRIRFGALDGDEDGRLTFAEYQVSGKRTFDFADRNKDGVVDAEDARLPPPARAPFQPGNDAAPPRR